MTNEEAIEILNKINPFNDNSKMQEYFESVEIAINSIQENSKLKAEIKQLKDDSKIIAKELVTQIREIGRLKSELETCKNRQVISEKERMIQGLNDFCDKFEMCNQCIFYGRCEDYDELSFEEIKSQLEEAEQSLKGTL